MSKSTFQSSLNQVPARAMIGQVKTINPAIYAVPHAQAKEVITIGNFVWEDDTESQDALYISPSADGSNIKPLGIVAHTGNYANTDLSLSASLSINSGQYADIIVKGDICVSAPNTAKRGDKVFANIYDGSIEIAASQSELEDAVETDFTVLEGGEKGCIITISNWV